MDVAGEEGLLQPIIVHKLNGDYELIAGQRRLTALNKLGRKTVPSMIVETSDPGTMMLISLIENVQRVDIDERDRSAAIVKLVDANNGDYAAVAKMLGKHDFCIPLYHRRPVIHSSPPQVLGVLLSGHRYPPVCPR